MTKDIRLDIRNNKLLNDKIIEIKQWEAEIKQLQELVESLKDEIKTEMTLNNIDVLETDTFTIRYKETVSNRFDTTTFKKENKDLYNRYLKESASMRFTIQ